MRIRTVTVAVLATAAVAWLALSGADALLEREFGERGPVFPPVAQVEGEQDITHGVEFDPVVPDTRRSSFARDNDFLRRQNAARQGWGPVLALQSETLMPGVEPVEPPSDVVDVLVAGGSFVWGPTTADLDVLWPRVLERELNARGGAVFRVRSLGRIPASFAQYGDWLTPSRLAETGADVVVLGFLGSDFYPSFEESALCHEYGVCVADGAPPISLDLRSSRMVSCLAGSTSVQAAMVRRVVNPVFPSVGRWLTERFCEPGGEFTESVLFDSGRWMSEPQDNPYWHVFDESVRRLAASLEGTPLVVFDYYSSLARDPRQKAVREQFEASKLKVWSSPRALDIMSSAPDPVSLQTNPASPYPGPRLAVAFAQDAADWIYQELGLPVNVASAPITNGPAAAPLLSNYLPTGMDASSGPDWLSVSTASLPSPGSPQYEDARFSLGSGGDVALEGPCADMGRPHVRLMLHPDAGSGENMLLRLAESDSELLAVPVGYSPQGSPLMGPPVLLEEGLTRSVSWLPEFSGLLVGPRKAGCPRGDVVLPRFQLDVRLDPS